MFKKMKFINILYRIKIKMRFTHFYFYSIFNLQIFDIHFSQTTLS